VPDDGLSMRPSRYPAHPNIESYSLSPQGRRALFVARGDVFTAPIEKGASRNLTNSSNAHDKHARWSPDGKKIAFISDLSGEEQVHLIDQGGSAETEQLTTGHRAMLSGPVWSPDGVRLAYSDKDGKLFILTVADKTVVEIVDSPRGGISDYDWSPNGGHLAFSMDEPNGFSSLHIWSVADGSVRRVTDEQFHEASPAWDRKGDYLYYLSTREFAPQISSVEWNYAGNRDTGIYGIALRKDVVDPFAPESDEAALEEEEKTEKNEESGSDKDDDKADDDKDDKKEEEKKKRDYITIDFEGLAQRSFRVPVDSDNIRGLSTTPDHLLFMTSGASYYGRASDQKTKLHLFANKDRKASVLVDEASGYAPSADGKKVLVGQKGAYYLYDVKPESKDKKTVSTKGLMVDRVPAQEWKTVFEEVWRRYRDFFYVKNMHGYDWKALGDQYRPLVDHVAHRSDLNYVLGEMVAELSVGHAYIAGGDFEIPDRPKVALPGARFELDEASGRYRIAKILSGHNEETKYRSPLTAVGIDINPGDYVLAIDGEDLAAPDNPYRLLQHKTDPVTLTISTKPEKEGAREITYQPITSEGSLLYLGWVLDNRDRVHKMTSGKVGYLHIPDMSSEGIYEFIKWFYPQIRKEGLIVDVRSNGGGNVSQWIIERLDSKLLGTRFGYSSDEPRTYPYTVFHGHKVCLMNETSASDGDIFPHRFRKSGLGPLIGKRSWGGVVGISSRGPLLDGGTVYVPMQATNDTDGAYIIEGHGVDPDIIVENDPQSVVKGRDPQLERGVQEVLRMMADHPMKLPSRPADPVKTK
jgi:tricorn protease